jgi:glycosyltransferase involved in cell wall biosynthesis
LADYQKINLNIYMAENSSAQLKIAFITPSFPPETGGMGNSCFQLANEIGKTEDVTVFLPSRKNKKWQTGNYRLEIFQPLFSFGYADIFRFTRKKLSNFDIVHVYYPYYGVSEHLPFKIKNTKIIFHHSMDAVGEGLSKLAFNLQRFFLQNKIFKKVDAIFVLSDDYAQNSSVAKIYQKKPTKCFSLPYGVDTEKFKKLKSEKNIENRSNLGLKSDDFVVFTAQALDKQHFFKGIDVLLKSAQILLQNEKIDLKIIIAGDGNLKKSYQEKAEKFGISKNVIFLGNIKNENLPEYYSLADISVVPSTVRTESFSLTTVESMACEIPVIVSDWPGIRATIENEETGLICQPKSSLDLASKIKYLYKNRDLLQLMSVAARKRAVEKYDLKNIAEKAKKYYKTILKNK